MCGQYTLELQSPEIQYLCKRDKRLARVISAIGPLTYSLHQDAYSFLIREIVEQMMSVKAASVIYGRLVDLCSGNVTPDTISSLTDDQLRSTGTSKAKVEYIRNVTRAVEQGVWDFDSMYSMTDAEIIRLMTSVRGIGNWTAKMYLMFVLGRPDVLPFEDGAFCQTYRWLYKTEKCSAEDIKARCKKWSPFSSTAARYFYQALDRGYTKNEFHLYGQLHQEE